MFLAFVASGQGISLSDFSSRQYNWFATAIDDKMPHKPSMSHLFCGTSFSTRSGFQWVQLQQVFQWHKQKKNHKEVKANFQLIHYSL